MEGQDFTDPFTTAIPRVLPFPRAGKFQKEFGGPPWDSQLETLRNNSYHALIPSVHKRRVFLGHPLPSLNQNQGLDFRRKDYL